VAVGLNKSLALVVLAGVVVAAGPLLLSMKQAEGIGVGA
jgi:hypothetical protein